MSRPLSGSRLRPLAARWCDAPTMERLIDPLITDLQAEDADAARAGRSWRRRWLRLAYGLAFAKVLVSHEASRTIGVLRDPEHEDHRAIKRTLVFSATMFVIAWVILVLPFAGAAAASPRAFSMIVYVTPQAVPLAIPVGLTVGIVWGLGRSRVSRRIAAATLAIALSASAVSLSMLAWVVPAANQTYRVARAGHVPARGVREIPLAELGRMLDAGDAISPSLRRNVAWTYHQHWAIVFAPVALASFSLAAARRGFRRRWALGLTGAGAIWGYYALMWGARGFDLDLAIPVPAAAWLANAAFVLLALVMLTCRMRSVAAAAP